MTCKIAHCELCVNVNNVTGKQLVQCINMETLPKLLFNRPKHRKLISELSLNCHLDSFYELLSIFASWSGCHKLSRDLHKMFDQIKCLITNILAP